MKEDRSVQINISGIPVAGVGGLGLVAMATIVSIAMPAARVVMLSGVVGGCLVALALVLARRHFKSDAPSGDDPTILFRALPSEDQRSHEPTDSPIRRRADSRFPDLPIPRSIRPCSSALPS
jgi:hypothetical protein